MSFRTFQILILILHRCHNVDGCIDMIDLMDNPSTLEELQTSSSRKQGDLINRLCVVL